MYGNMSYWCAGRGLRKSSNRSKTPKSRRNRSSWKSQCGPFRLKKSNIRRSGRSVWSSSQNSGLSFNPRSFQRTYLNQNGESSFGCLSIWP